MESDSNNLRGYFGQLLSQALHQTMKVEARPPVESYLLDLMTGFMREDLMFPIKEADGTRVTRIADMLQFADIRLKAVSFEQERFVHRHIGCLLLFCEGMFPEFLPVLGAAPAGSARTESGWLNPRTRAIDSLLTASLFDYAPHAAEAKILKILGERFDDYAAGLTLVRNSFDGFEGPGWGHALAG